MFGKFKDTLSSLLEEPWGSKKGRKRRKKKTEGRIYFIQQGINGPIKIGFSTNPNKRISNLQTSNPIPLKMLGTIRGTVPQEQGLHKSLSQWRIGGEWFQPSEEVLERIAELIEKGRLGE